MTTPASKRQKTSSQSGDPYKPYGTGKSEKEGSEGSSVVPLATVPSPLPSNNNLSPQQIKKDLRVQWLNVLEKIDPGNDMFNESFAHTNNDRKIKPMRLFKRCLDGRQSSWERVIENMTQRVERLGIHEDECFLLRMKTGGIVSATYPDIKFGHIKHRSVNMQAHRVVFLLHHPEYLHRLEQLESDLHVAHRCHNAHCVNPRHLALVEARFNQLTKACVTGARSLCVHTPHCFFNDKNTGRFLPCYNSITRTHPMKPSRCKHNPKCPLYTELYGSVVSSFM